MNDNHRRQGRSLIPPGWEERLSAAGVAIQFLETKQLVFDERTILKCRYSCPAWGRHWTCSPESWGPKELIPLLQMYRSVLLLTSTDGPRLWAEALALERAFFAERYRWALAVSVTPCSSCESCTYPEEECRHKADLRPESAMAGIDTIATMEALGIKQPPGAWLRASYLFVE